MKGQGLSITTIVVAAIALLVLVVLVAVFTGQFAGFSEGTRDCSALSGAVCIEDDGGVVPDGYVEVFGRRCPETDYSCYVPVGTVENPAGSNDE